MKTHGFELIVLDMTVCEDHASIFCVLHRLEFELVLQN